MQVTLASSSVVQSSGYLIKKGNFFKETAFGTIWYVSSWKVCNELKSTQKTDLSYFFVNIFNECNNPEARDVQGSMRLEQIVKIGCNEKHTWREVEFDLSPGAFHWIELNLPLSQLYRSAQRYHLSKNTSNVVFCVQFYIVFCHFQTFLCNLIQNDLLTDYSSRSKSLETKFYSPNLLTVAGITKMLADVPFKRYFFPFENEGISVLVLQ